MEGLESSWAQKWGRRDLLLPYRCSEHTPSPGETCGVTVPSLGALPLRDEERPVEVHSGVLPRPGFGSGEFQLLVETHRRAAHPLPLLANGACHYPPPLGFPPITGPEQEPCQPFCQPFCQPS